MRKFGLFTFIALTSCTSIKVPVSDSINHKVVDNSVTTTEYQIGDNGYLVGYLFDLKNINKDSLKTKKIIVKKDERQIQVSINYNNKIITRHFKYKTTGKELRCKTKTKIGLVPPIVWSLRNESNVLCFDSTDNLIIYHNHGGAIVLVAFPIGGASIGQINGVFTKY